MVNTSNETVALLFTGYFNLKGTGKTENSFSKYDRIPLESISQSNISLIKYDLE